MHGFGARTLSWAGGDGVQRAAVRLRVLGELVPAGDHALDGQVLPHHHERSAGAFTPMHDNWSVYWHIFTRHKYVY